MAGTISSLGLGSGILTSDIIDQLREADESAIITPIENKIESNTNKQTVLSELKTLMGELNTQVVTLSDPDLYQNKTSDVLGSSVNIEATASASLQNFDINVSQLATKDIWQSANSFAAESSTLNAQTMTFNIDVYSFDVDIADGDTLTDVVDKINEQTDGKIEASVLNIGGDNPYKLILKSSETGAANQITASSTLSDGNELTFGQVGNPAQDAKFTYDGVEITRSTNAVEDLIDGVNIELKNTGSSSVEIGQDFSKLTEEMQNFADKYNEVINKLTEVTKFNSEAGTRGVFQGNSEIRMVQAELNNIINTTITGDGKTIADFGLTPERGGTLDLSISDLEEALDTNAQELESFFRGTDGSDGLFNKFEDSIFDLMTSSDGPLKALGNNIESYLDTLEEEQTKAQEKLDDRYEIMTKRFAAFDAVIAKLGTQADTLTAMIDAASAAKE